MKEKYIDYELENIIENAINKAIANLSLEGMFVNEEEKQKLKEEFMETYKIKILERKK